MVEETLEIKFSLSSVTRAKAFVWNLCLLQDPVFLPLPETK